MEYKLPTPEEDRQLLFALHDIRREERFIRAQEWFKAECFPVWAEDIRDMITAGSPDFNPKLTLVISYMEMAASLIYRGVPNAELFIGPTSEHALIMVQNGEIC